MRGGALHLRGVAVAVLAGAGLALWSAEVTWSADEPALSTAAAKTLQTYCLDCHSTASAEARINLEQMTGAPDFGRGFKDWEKVVRMLRQRKMPPAKATQPADADRTEVIADVENALKGYIEKYAGDPGPVVIRRLTSAEYAYSVQDLTGLDLGLERTFVSDAVGGEGFTNVGGAQFTDDVALERYLEAAKTVAEHAVIGSGSLSFFPHPGQTGRELSAMDRIQRLYRQHGFRTAAGEGGKPFGLDSYPRALFVAWRYRHRAALGLRDATLEQLAREEGLSVRYCEHIWKVLHSGATSFPLSVIVAEWNALPAPNGDRAENVARAACNQLYGTLRDWQKTLAGPARDEEEAAVLTDGDVRVEPTHDFIAAITWPEEATSTTIQLTVVSASRHPADGALVIWRNPRLRFRRMDNRRGEFVPLRTFLAPESVERLSLGRHPAGADIADTDFVLSGSATVPITLQFPAGKTGARLYVDVALDLERGADRIVRCSISDGDSEGVTAAAVSDTSTLLGNPSGSAVAEWRTGVAEFARLLPEVSHREPAPSDRDPIPPPFNNEYNLPERNHFHTAVKYHRDDRFLVEHMLDDAARRELDQAWTDLLTSFEYHDINLHFVAQKFGVDPGADHVAKLDPATIRQLPAEPRAYIQRLYDEHCAMQAALLAAESGHVDDALRFADRAWRRPLATDESQRLRAFYSHLRRDNGLDHTAAIRALLTRILVAPAFLYRAESQSSPNAPREESLRPKGSPTLQLSDHELASRLSYFLWSSLPDDELRRAAAAGELHDPAQLEAQARRMLREPKARRLAAEFFAQWLGFYRFDEFRGIDGERFPEFNESLKSAMYDEALSFFEHIVREDRPVREVLFADYTFLNRALAEHYGIDAKDLPGQNLVRVADVSTQHRGGLLGLAAVLTATSAPLRTSAVKRGDWVLRRVIGTPVPPPPADAGSIPADDVLTDRLTVRQRLERHRTDASCVNCHSRIDALGFALEHFDPLGRWRTEYRDGQPIDPAGVLMDGTEIVGLDGLKRYLQREEPQFQRNLSSKLLGYALGRSELASDRPLLEGMLADLQHDGRFSELVIRIVSSRQFRYRRSFEDRTVCGED